MDHALTRVEWREKQCDRMATRHDCFDKSADLEFVRSYLFWMSQDRCLTIRAIFYSLHIRLDEPPTKLKYFALVHDLQELLDHLTAANLTMRSTWPPLLSLIGMAALGLGNHLINSSNDGVAAA